MSQHARENPELYAEAEEIATELSWGRCMAHRVESVDRTQRRRCELDAPHPRESHVDEEGVRW